MAMPPCQVEDQTDEDFFDKLVEDDDNFVCTTRSIPTFVDDNDSDELKAFSKLSVSEVDSIGVDPHRYISVGKDSKVGSIGVDSSGDIGVGDDGKKGLVSSNFFSVANDSTTSTSSNLVEGNDSLKDSAGVKEVDWSVFNSESHFNAGSGFGSYSDFLTEVNVNSGEQFPKLADAGNFRAELNSSDGVFENHVAQSSSGQSVEGQIYTAQIVDGQDLNSSQYWENLYPGWKYDPNTGQWTQLDGYSVDATTNVKFDDISRENDFLGSETTTEQRSDIFYSQQMAQSNANGTTGTISNWNQVSQENVQYPTNMVFDPQYPDWYYDTITQEWKLLESYKTTAINQPTIMDHNPQNHNSNVLTNGNFPQNNFNTSYDLSESVVGNIQSQHLSSNQDQVFNKNITMWQPETVPKTEAINFTDVKQFENVYEHSFNYHQTESKPTRENAIYQQTNQSFEGNNGFIGFQSSVPSETFWQQTNNSMKVPSNYFESQKATSFSQKPVQSFTQFSHGSSEGRVSAGRPPHALVTFGFGGKLVIMKDSSSLFTSSAFVSKDSAAGVVNVFKLAEVVMEKIDSPTIGFEVHNYFKSLCKSSFPGPLVGGSVGSKELNKWIDEKIANSENRDYMKGEISKTLFSLLKIACQYYGKLRSPLGNDQALKDGNCPELAVAKLLAPDRKDGDPFNEYGARTSCLQKPPSEAHVQATALDVQKLLVSGRKKEALECAQQGQLWGPALALASELGTQYFSETVKQMAVHQLVAGSPLRTLCLLIAGQPTDVFANSSTQSNMSGPFNFPQQPVQIGSNYVLDEWKENLAIITANRTNDDELVIIHLGDSLWKEKGEVIAAHICYLIAEASFELYSDSARLCLIGADHWQFSRTYASPEAIQRTELYEYSQVLGNTQFTLLPFQPYKLIYAHMLAEVGRLADSLKYCQAIVKSLKTGRTPEVDIWKQLVLSLEERIKTHQQGGYSANLAPTKIVGKFLNFIDSTAHRVVGGGLPPPIPSSHSKIQYNEQVHQQVVPRVLNSQSTMSMSTLMPSASVEPINEWTDGGNRLAVPNRSISEPDLSPRKVDSSNKTSAEKAPASGRSSRFGNFGSQLFQKTVGLVLRSRPDKQAKLGDANKFYYDEKLKRWVEEGVAPPAEEAALPPPPTTAAFLNGAPQQNGVNNSPNESFNTSGGPQILNSGSSDLSSGIQSMPPSSNQFSARGRMPVRSRYVDTFNKGGGTPTNLFQSPSIPTAKTSNFNPNFFVPSPATVSTEEIHHHQTSTVENSNESPVTNTIIYPKESSSSSSTTSMPHRFPSMDNIVQKRVGVMGNDNNTLDPQSRRAVSWSGNLSDANKHSTKMVTSPYMPLSNSPLKRVSSSNDSFTDVCHEVEL